MISLADRYRRWFDYEKDANKKVLDSYSSVPEAALNDPSFQKAIDLFGHIMAARKLWLYRFGLGDKPAPDLFSRSVTLAELPDLADRMNKTWTDYYESLDDEALVKVFEYQSLEGDRFRNSVEDILTQLFGHALYHRGQINVLIRSLGGTPAPTDFVFWTRQPLGEKVE